MRRWAYCGCCSWRPYVCWWVDGPTSHQDGLFPGMFIKVLVREMIKMKAAEYEAVLRHIPPPSLLLPVKWSIESLTERVGHTLHFPFLSAPPFWQFATGNCVPVIGIRSAERPRVLVPQKSFLPPHPTLIQGSISMRFLVAKRYEKSTCAHPVPCQAMEVRQRSC